MSQQKMNMHFFVPHGDYILQHTMINAPDNLILNHIELSNACYCGNLERVNHLLRDITVDPSIYDGACLQNAACSRDITIVDRLLKDSRVDPFNAFVNMCNQDFTVRRLLTTGTLDEAFQWANYSFDVLGNFTKQHIVNIIHTLDIISMLSTHPKILWNTFSNQPIGLRVIEKARYQWYIDRASTFSELHNDLVATVHARQS